MNCLKIEREKEVWDRSLILAVHLQRFTHLGVKKQAVVTKCCPLAKYFWMEVNALLSPSFLNCCRASSAPGGDNKRGRALGAGDVQLICPLCMSERAQLCSAHVPGYAKTKLLCAVPSPTACLWTGFWAWCEAQLALCPSQEWKWMLISCLTVLACRCLRSFWTDQSWLNECSSSWRQQWVLCDAFLPCRF